MEDDRKNKTICLEGCCRLRFATVAANLPSAIEPAFWSAATATGEVCGEDKHGHIQVSAQGLIPLGVYTLWFLTDKGPLPAAPLNAVYTADGADPNLLIVNNKGILNYYIAPLDYNPFRGIPFTGGYAMIQGVAITFNALRTTYGKSPGIDNVTTFNQLVSDLCLPRDE